MAQRAFALFGRRAVDIRYQEMVTQLDRHPDITAINRDVVQKALTEGSMTRGTGEQTNRGGGSFK